MRIERRATGLIEALVALGVLLVLTVPVINAMVQSSLTTLEMHRRLVLELRGSPRGSPGSRPRAGRRRPAGDQRVKALEQLPRLGQRLAAQRLGHHRGRCRRDRAAHALEGDVRDAPVLDPQVDGHAVAAERVVPGGAVAGRGQPPRQGRAERDLARSRSGRLTRYRG